MCAYFLKSKDGGGTFTRSSFLFSCPYRSLRISISKKWFETYTIDEEIKKKQKKMAACLPISRYKERKKISMHAIQCYLLSLRSFNDCNRLFAICDLIGFYFSTEEDCLMIRKMGIERNSVIVFPLSDHHWQFYPSV